MDFLSNFGGSIQQKNARPETISSIIRAKQPTRYYRGEKPSWAETHDDNEDEDEDGDTINVNQRLQKSKSTLSTKQEEKITTNQQSINHNRQHESEIKETSVERDIEEDEQVPRASQRRRRVYKEPEVIITNTNSNETSSSTIADTLQSSIQNSGVIVDDEVSVRRAKVLERKKAQQAAAETTAEMSGLSQTTIDVGVGISHDLLAPLNVQAGVAVRLSGSLAIGSGRIISEPAVVSTNDGNRNRNKGDNVKNSEAATSLLPKDNHTYTTDNDKDDDDDDDDEEEEEEDAAVPWGYGRPLIRPIFKKKEDRITIKPVEAREADEAKEAEDLNRINALRVEESRKLVAETILREDAALSLVDDDDGDRNRPDDTDRPEDAELDLDEWRLREMRRLKRDADNAVASANEIAETLRRRTLDAETRAQEDKLLEAQGLKVFQKVKEKRAFLQKYSHKGAFYMDEDSIKKTSAAGDGVGDIRLRSIASARELEAGFDKSALPAIMQVKNFGLKGRSKYTHLTNEDTSSKGYFFETNKKK
jgi:microfibrillar-associated protein 1